VTDMARVTHCKVCRKEVDERTRNDSIQIFGIVVCSMKCWMKCKEADALADYLAEQEVENERCDI